MRALFKQTQTKVGGTVGHRLLEQMEQQSTEWKERASLLAFALLPL